jgi:hypothetical protein
VLIDHVQPREVTIDRDACPPFAPKAVGALLTLTWHVSEDGAVSDVLVLLQTHDEAREAGSERDHKTVHSAMHQFTPHPHLHVPCQVRKSLLFFEIVIAGAGAIVDVFGEPRARAALGPEE